MIFILKLLILFGLVKLLEQNEKPILCAAIYSVIFFVLSFSMDTGFVDALIGGILSFAFAAMYFWLLDRFMNSGWFWPIFAFGILLGFV